MRYRRRLTTSILVMAVAHETTPTITAAQSPTTTNPIDAYVREALRANLSLAQTQRIASAYEYVVALSALLAASNRGDSFRDYLLRSDRITAP